VRVGVVGPLAPDYFAENVSDALKHTGHTVASLGTTGPRHRSRLLTTSRMLARQALPALDERSQRRIVRAAVEAECDVVINLDEGLMPSTVRQLKRAGMRVAFWFPDHVANMGRQFMLLAPYDAIFFKDPHIVNRLHGILDLPIYYLPQGCNPRWHRPMSEAGTEPYLVIAGNMYASRVRLLERLAAKGIPLRLYGGGFPRWLGETPLRAAHTGRYIVREEKARVFRSAAGVLNTMHPAEVAGVNARLFEATGCGAAVLTDFRPTVPELFAVGDEVLVFDDFDSLVDQATRLLEETGLTSRLGDAAARRAHRDHTYDLRVAEILDKLT
jgi:spore maturation protein CgeB